MSLIHQRNEGTNDKDYDILIMDSGGGTHGTITPRAWKIIERTNMTTELTSYQNKEEPLTLFTRATVSWFIKMKYNFFK